MHSWLRVTGLALGFVVACGSDSSTPETNACAGTPCGAACVDVTTDPSNCGACGFVCGAGMSCLGGACVLAGTGGAVPMGGVGTGGTVPTGGVGTGGTVPTGGVGTGGALPTGGAPPTGGVGTGGALPTGGAAPTGGAVPTGGTGGVELTGGQSIGGQSTGGWATGGWGPTGGASTGGAPTGGASTGGASGEGPGGASSDEPFSFFVTSLEAMQELSGSEDGFGGDLRFGEATGLAGADKICQTIAAKEGFGHKTWRAFLSTSTEDAIDRVGTGPWYDRLGRLIAEDVQGLLGERPAGDPDAVNDLPNEKGVQEHTLDSQVDDHDTLTGSDSQGRYLGRPEDTCNDWTSTTSGRPMCGHSWPGGPSRNWIEAHSAPGCAPGVNLVQTGGGFGGESCVGCSGGYGAIYCFALTP